ncbi:hypothetical protein [Mycobacterium sp. E796]|uniref:hypothetical protein n=1 Tax=Mycobacterium sp. E796 TaxID=1834151 RepID=UPI0018D28270
MGEVGCQAFVGLFGGKADVGGFGPFVGLRVDQPGRAQVPVDRRRDADQLNISGIADDRTIDDTCEENAAVGAQSGVAGLGGR